MAADTYGKTSTAGKRPNDAADGSFYDAFTLDTSAFPSAPANHVLGTALLQTASVSSTSISGSIPVQGIHFDGVTTHYADGDETAPSSVVVTSAGVDII